MPQGRGLLGPAPAADRAGLLAGPLRDDDPVAQPPRDRAQRVVVADGALPVPADLLPRPGGQGTVGGVVALRRDELLPLRPVLRHGGQARSGPTDGRPGHAARVHRPGLHGRGQLHVAQHRHRPPDPKGGWWALATVWLPAYLDLFALGMFLAATSAWFHQHDNEWRIFSNPLFPFASWICAGACFWGVSHLGIPTRPALRGDLPRPDPPVALRRLRLLPSSPRRLRPPGSGARVPSGGSSAPGPWRRWA